MRKIRGISRNPRQAPDNSLLSEIVLIIKSSLIAVVITLFCFVIFAVLMTLANLPESFVPPINQVIRVLSIALGGAFAARSAGSKGWMKGALTGLLYMIWAIIISSLFFEGSSSFNAQLGLDILMGLIVGAIGGAIGINLK